MNTNNFRFIPKRLISTMCNFSARSFQLRRLLLFAAVCLLLPLSGCSNKPKTVSAGGTVTLQDGTPLAGAMIEFQLTDDAMAPTASAKVQADGSFKLGTTAEDDGALEGQHRVLIVGPAPERKKGWETGVMTGRGTGASNVPMIDPRYRSFETSGLSYTVTDDELQNHFEIKVDRLK